MATPEPLDLVAIAASLRGRRISTARLTLRSDGALDVEIRLDGQLRLVLVAPKDAVFLDDYLSNRKASR